jgi:hypothetical protein
MSINENSIPGLHWYKDHQILIYHHKHQSGYKNNNLAPNCNTLFSLNLRKGVLSYVFGCIAP